MDDHLPLTTLQSVTLSSGPFIFLWSLTRRYVSSKGAFSFARPTLTFINRINAILSLALGYLILRATFKISDGLEINLSTADLAYIYHCFQFYQYLDVFLTVMSGLVVGSHTAFSHITMPYLTYFRVLHASDWQVFALLNCAHNFLMYSYLGGASVLKPVLVMTGYLQLGIPAAIDLSWLSQHGTGAQEATNRMIAILLWVRYGMMFREELRGEKKPKDKKT